jgi:hypothetical protein
MSGIFAYVNYIRLRGLIYASVSASSQDASDGSQTSPGSNLLASAFPEPSEEALRAFLLHLAAENLGVSDASLMRNVVSGPLALDKWP